MMKRKLLTIAMMVALLLAAITRGQAQEYDGPCLPPTHGLDDHQSAFCGSTETQTIALSAGTNWFSTYVDITLQNLKDALVEALPGTTGIKIISQNGTTTWNGSSWRGNIPWNVMNMYMIQVPIACEISLEGLPVNPAEHPVTIKNGINWIAFPLSESMTLLNTFSGFAVSGDRVISQSGTSGYNGSTWRGSFSSLVPGKGYIYKSAHAETRTFTFPVGAK